MFRKVLVVVVLSGIFGCQSVEEATKWEASILSEHRKIFVECKGKSFAFKEWLEKKKSCSRKGKYPTKPSRQEPNVLKRNLALFCWTAFQQLALIFTLKQV